MLTEANASQIAELYYGMTGQAKRLPGEYDTNFYFRSKTGQEFLLKISHNDELESVVKLQNTLLQTIESQHLPFSVPSLQLTINGTHFAKHELDADKQRYVRLFNFLPGQLLAHTNQQTPSLWMSLGTQIGLLCVSLKNFHDTQAERYIKWDLQHSTWIAEYLACLDNKCDRSCVDFFTKRFITATEMKLPTLRQSVIHGDLNDYNILVSPDSQVSGFIDFGDVVKTATVCELAIALAYAMLDKSDPFTVADAVIHGFNHAFPLNESELDVLFDLICMRLCVSVVNSAIRKSENSAEKYFIVSERPAWNLLKALQGVCPHYARSRFRSACAKRVITTD